ncbi:MAG: DUF3891 family protein [Planctomycetota bacterium]
MIRREIQFPGEELQWLLISQLEHARISGELAAAAIRHFPSRFQDDSSEPIVRARAEIVRTIVRHDDGWAQWEAWPGLDDEGRPPAFTEMPQDDAIEIWTGCADEAERLGPLAAFMVSSHFLALLERSREKSTPAAEAWLKKYEPLRDEWREQWYDQHPGQVDSWIPEEALHWLQDYDLMSLWLCLRAPIGGEVRESWPEPYTVSDERGVVLSAQRSSETASQVTLQQATVEVRPWRYLKPMVLAVNAHLVPQKRYRDTKELMSARRPTRLLFRLVPPASS